MRCLLILISFLMSIEGVQANSAPSTDSSSSRIAAVVNNTIISQIDLMNRLRFAALSSGLEPTTENLEKMKAQMLRVMIDEQLQLQIGKRYGLEITNDHVQATMKDIEESSGLPPHTITKMMEEHKIPLKIFEDQIKAQLTWVVFIREKYPHKTLEDQLGKKNHSEFSPSLQIADWEVDQEIKLQKEKETKKQYHLAEIVLPFDSPDQEEEVKNTLNQLHEELQKGAQFQALAQQFSQSATSSQGGDMGWLTEDQMEPEIKDAVSQIHPGQLSAPVRTPQGYVIIAFIEQKLPGSEGQMLLTVQQVLLPFPQDTTEEKAQEIMEKGAEIGGMAKSCPALEKISKEKFPSASFHLTKGEPLSNFPGPLQDVVNSLDINQISAPLLTQEGALLVMVCEKQSPKTQDFSREDAFERIASRKHSLLARRELRDLRRQAFIDMRM
jgi:peptidyl-prolyl cis-trans isomerase SurA